MKTDWKDILLNTLSEEERKDAIKGAINRAPTTAPAKRQHFRIELDKRQKGKIATLITGFEGSYEELKELAKTLKVKCGSGGSCRDGEILIQGDVRKKAEALLNEMGHKTKTIC